MFLLVPAYPGCPGSKAVKRSLLLLLLFSTYEMIDLMDLISSRRSFHRILPLDLIDLYLKNEQISPHGDGFLYVCYKHRRCNFG